MADYYDRNGDPMTLAEWADKFEDPDYKRVEFTDLGDGREVSTVWLGLDHSFVGPPPHVFETMVFGGPVGEDNFQQRYSTEREARAGHTEIVGRLTDGR